MGPLESDRLVEEEDGKAGEVGVDMFGISWRLLGCEVALTLERVTAFCEKGTSSESPKFLECPKLKMSVEDL